MTTEILNTFLTNCGAFLTEGVTWITKVLGVVTDNAVTFVMVCAMPIVGWGIGGLKRLIRL